jgi:hypothetical protein
VTEEDRELVLLLDHELFDVEDQCLHPEELRFRLAKVDLGSDSSLEAVARERHVLPPRFQSAPGDVEPAIETP